MPNQENMLLAMLGAEPALSRHSFHRQPKGVDRGNVALMTPMFFALE